ncbi:hypothetical protein [Halorubrum sp. DTA46]|uniref:hypothetical protein n=1 Tax=Halorubrum sp. DTA46 TaxID=3402162 RepID=UPI003AAB899A
MERRNFLIGMGSTAAGASALIGSGAFSRIESQRSVTIQVAEDANAYLGMRTLNTPNSNNFVGTDGNGHLEIDIGDFDPDGTNYEYQTGSGVNSDSFTYFDGLFELCNQGKADATISYALPESSPHTDVGNDWTAPDAEYDQQVVAFYYIDESRSEAEDGVDSGGRVIVNEGDTVDLALGECEEIGIRTVTKGVDATTGEALIDGEIVVTADAPEAGQPNNS